MNFTIGSLAQMGGVGVETIRYYQRRGLLSVPVPKGGPHSKMVRRYGEDDLRRLQFIRSAQTAGFTLNEIAELLALDQQADRAQVRALAHKRIAALDLQIASLQRARQDLDRLAVQCVASADDPAQYCPILKAFDPQDARP